MRRFTLTLALVTAATLGMTVVAGAAPPVQDYHADLETLNDSGVSGTATLHLEGDQLTVIIQAGGLEAGKTHPQHIHGLSRSEGSQSNGNARCPTPAADDNGDGIVDIGEGLPFYGPVMLALTPFQDASDGTIDYQETFTVDPQTLGPLQNRAIVLHGLTVDGTYVPATPVACGQIRITPGN